MKLEQFFLKSDIYDAFQPVLGCYHSQIIKLYTSYITQVCFTLNLLTKHTVVFKIWMNNLRMGLANLEQVVRKKSVERMEWYKKSKKWSNVRKLW